MTEQDLLARYLDPDTMHQGLRSVTRRLDRQTLNEAMLEAVDARLPALEADFLDYFPDLIHHASVWLDDRKAHG
jgi:acyl carrier protein phosphodiesterase